MDKESKKVRTNAQEEPAHSFVSTLFTTSEGHILLTGILLGVLYFIWLAVTGLWEPKKSQLFLGMTVTHILAGRAAGMSFGYTAGFGHRIVIPINIAIETIQVLLFYPLFVFSWQQLLVIKQLKKTMERIHNAAERNRQFIHRYGLLGLFAFVWIPFWMTGSAVGCVIGFLLNLPAWLTIGVVLSGAYMAIASWAFLLYHLHNHASQFSPYAPIGILLLVIIIVLVGQHRHKKQHDHHSSSE